MTTNDFEIIDNVLKKYNGSSDLVVIPDGVITIGDHAFSNCSNITNINIPDTVTSIGKYAFFKCSNLTSINIPDSVKTIGKYAFSECQGLKDENGFVIICDILFGYYGEDEDVTIPQGTKSISRKAFYESIYLNSVNIPDSVTSIEKYAFKGCKSLKDKDGFVIVHNILFDYFNEDKDITIPNGVNAICESAFFGCDSLVSVNIPNTVTYIGEGAFEECINLTSVNMSNSISHIGDFAFSGCKNLTNINVPSSVTDIGENTFYRCYKLGL